MQSSFRNTILLALTLSIAPAFMPLAHAQEKNTAPATTPSAISEKQAEIDRLDAEASKAFEKKEWSEAERLYRFELDEKGKEDARILCNIGITLIRQDKIDEALIFLQRAVKADYKYGDAHYQIGLIHYWQNKFVDAEAELKIAISIDAKNDDAFSHLGYIFQYLGKIEEALLYFRKAAEIAPKYAHYQFEIGVCLFDLKKYEESISYFRKGIQLDPTSSAGKLEVAEKRAAPVSTLGFTIGKTTLATVLTTLQGKETIQRGTRTVGGKPFSKLDMNGKSFGIAGTIHVQMLFDTTKTLVAVFITVNKDRYDDLVGILKGKYVLDSEKAPFVGDHEAHFTQGKTAINVFAEHLSFQMTIEYIQIATILQINSDRMDDAFKKQQGEKKIL
jgi:tetratricopeptide (TPR) repeat protein